MDTTENGGVTIWITGLSGSGKSTLARVLGKRLKDIGRNVEILDGDEIRENISVGLGFTKPDRDINIRRVGHIAKLLTRNGVAVIAAVISPYREGRDVSRKQIERFVLVYCRCPIDVAESRDVKGLYRKARNGEIQFFTGINDPYEEPIDAEVIVDTDKETVSESLEKIWRALHALGYL